MSLYPILNQVLPESEQADDFNYKTPILRPTAKSSVCGGVFVEVENVVATADLKQHLDLNAILEVTPGARYSPERFPGLIYRLKKPRTTTLLFASGKMVCTGAKSTRSANTAITQVINQLSDHGIVIITKPTPQIENIVASANLNGTIDLENAAQQLHKTLYEPEQFPGLIHRMNNPKTVFLIFTNGKIVCTGTRTVNNLHTAIQNLRTTLQNHHLITNSNPPTNKQKPAVIVEQVQHVP
jgi:transcription initiation factor TFIID TATA-box-binding protein